MNHNKEYRPPLEIHLYPPEADCCICGAITPYRWGLPFDDCGELAPVDADEWAGCQASCQACYEAHEQGLLTADNAVYWRRRAELERRALTSLIVRE